MERMNPVYLLESKSDGNVSNEPRHIPKALYQKTGSRRGEGGFSFCTQKPASVPHERPSRYVIFYGEKRGKIVA